jgi:hypothetical protein
VLAAACGGNLLALKQPLEWAANSRALGEIGPELTQHEVWLAMLGAREQASACQRNKEEFGGDDGARTRDLRRDRPAF